MTLPKIRKIGIGASMAVVLLAMLWMHTPNMRQSQDVSPTETVNQLDQYAREDNWTKAHALMDYRSKGQDLVPDLWKNGTEKARSGLVRLLQDMFASTWLGFHEQGEIHPLTQTEIAPGMTMVEQGAGEQQTTLRYWLRYNDAAWTIIDRTSKTGRIHNEPSGKVNVVKNRIASQLGGRDITLADFVANAPSWVKRVRARRFRVGDDQVNLQ